MKARNRKGTCRGAVKCSPAITESRDCSSKSGNPNFMVEDRERVEELTGGYGWALTELEALIKSRLPKVQQRAEGTAMRELGEQHGAWFRK